MTAPLKKTRLGWPLGFIVLAAAAIPAFTGWGLNRVPGEIISGIAWGWGLYLGLVHLLILVVLRYRWYANILTIAAWITLPVVFVGAAMTWLGVAAGMTAINPTGAGIHYTQLCITMLTVVPLALALVAAIPFNQLERQLLFRPSGITLTQKKLLMVVRVFNHTAFFVLPSLLEVLREERVMAARPLITTGTTKGMTKGASKGPGGLWSRLRALVRVITYLAVESICAAVQFIPLWAYEIGQLPEPGSGPEPESGPAGAPPMNEGMKSQGGPGEVGNTPHPIKHQDRHQVRH